MPKYNLCIIRPKGFLHSSAFLEIRDSLAWALSSFNHETMCTENSFSQGESTNIIFGAELLDPTTVLPPNSILYNLEQPTHPNLDTVRKMVKSSGTQVWDYNTRNIEDWHARGIPALHLPIGYTPNLTRIPKAVEQDIDCLFYGWFTPRRIKLIESLRTAGLKVVATDCCYGGGRDQLVSRAKLVLNINHDGRDLFNIARVSFLCANSKCVVSESASDLRSYSTELCHWSEYSDLVANCVALVQDDSLRQAQEQNGFHAIRDMDFTASVAAVLNHDHQPQPTTPSNYHSMIQARYEQGCRQGDMVDFLPWLRSHAKGKILEIGTRDGASTSAFLLGLEENDPQGHLTSLDVNDCSKLWSHPQWTFHRANSLNVEFPDASFDLALIDGNHDRSFYIGDLYNCYHWVKPGGLILTHDLVPERGHEFYAVAIREEWDKFLRAHSELKHYILTGKYGMGVIER